RASPNQVRYAESLRAALSRPVTSDQSASEVMPRAGSNLPSPASFDSESAREHTNRSGAGQQGKIDSSETRFGGICRDSPRVPRALLRFGWCRLYAVDNTVPRLSEPPVLLSRISDCVWPTLLATGVGLRTEAGAAGPS